MTKFASLRDYLAGLDRLGDLQHVMQKDRLESGGRERDSLQHRTPAARVHAQHRGSMTGNARDTGGGRTDPGPASAKRAPTPQSNDRENATFNVKEGSS
jgi:hypothetical protein